jgi:hypothetical protein
LLLTAATILNKLSLPDRTIFCVHSQRVAVITDSNLVARIMPFKNSQQNGSKPGNNKGKSYDRS